MGLRANHISNSIVMDNEIGHIRNMKAVVKMAITHIEEEISNIGYLDEDIDATPFEESTVEFSFLDIRIWIDIRLQNDSCNIECVDVKDNQDNDCPYLSRMLNQDLVSYYTSDSIQRVSSYNQAKEIQHDQNDPYNLRPKMALGYGVNPKYLQDLKSICEEEESKIHQFLEYGYALKLKIKRETRPIDLIRVVLPMIISGVFIQVNRQSPKKQIATFIHDNFVDHHGKYLNIKTLINNTSTIYAAN